MVPLMILFIAVLFYGDYMLFERGYQLYGRLLGEFFSGIFLLIVVAQLAAHRRFDMPPKYILWIIAFAFIIIAGIVANGVQTGAVVMGIRENFKYAPLFLIPIVYHFRPNQIRTILFAILFFACLQLPYMIHQRYTQDWFTGDYITGTLLFSGPVSIFLICCWAVLFAFYLRKHIQLHVFLGASAILLFPTMLNETKASIVLLPFAFVLPLVFSPHIKRLGLKLSAAGFCFVLTAIAYSEVNALLGSERGDGSMLDLFLNPERLTAYLMPAAQGGSWMGRLDKLLLAWDHISQSGVSLLLGVGLGNVNDTSSALFAGEYTEFGNLLGTAFNQYLWETGILGVTLALILPILTLADARRGAAISGLSGSLAIGWTAVSAIIFVCAFYIRAPDVQAISYLYFFFSGYVASESYRMRAGAQTVSTDRLPRSVSRQSNPIVQLRGSHLA